MIDISSSSLAIEIYNRLHGLPGNSGRCVLHVLITLKLDDNISVCLLYEIMYKRLSYKVLPESTFGYKEFCCNGVTAERLTLDPVDARSKRARANRGFP